MFLEAGDFGQLLVDRLLVLCGSGGMTPGGPALSAALEEARAASSCSADSHARLLALTPAASSPASNAADPSGVGGGAGGVWSSSIDRPVREAAAPPRSALAPELLPLAARAASAGSSASLCYLCPWPQRELLGLRPGGPAERGYAACFSVLARVRACLTRLNSAWLSLLTKVPLQGHVLGP